LRVSKGIRTPLVVRPGRLKGTISEPEKPSALGYPVFCLRHLQRGYDVTNCQRDQQAALAKKLRALSQLTWLEVMNAPRHGLGKENIARNCLRVAVPAFVTDDVTLWALRFSGLNPMVGYKRGDVFHAVWLDHDFTAYRH
jgi:hypothetical protein